VGELSPLKREVRDSQRRGTRWSKHGMLIEYVELSAADTIDDSELAVDSLRLERDSVMTGGLPISTLGS